MRRKNGYAGVHEIASRTRVLATVDSSPVKVPGQKSSVAPLAGEEIPGTFGPYRIEGILWRRPTDLLLAGYDEILERGVWIHRYEDAFPARPISWLAQPRQGRLQWLQGSRQPGECWDAYEMPAGTSLVEWVRSHGRLSWLFRGGPLLYLLGISLQTLDGRRAGAGRCLLRSLLVWGTFLPFLPFFPGRKLAGLWGWSAGSWEVAQLLALLLGIGCLIYGIASPERGAADRIAGTRQVLR